MKIDRGSENPKMAGEGYFRRSKAFSVIFLVCALAYVKKFLYLCMRFCVVDTMAFIIKGGFYKFPLKKKLICEPT